ncbi:MAG: FliH/SctL family protein [Caulobacteraceae bacterium]
MSKVYKSGNVQMGSPKPIINNFKPPVKPEIISEGKQEQETVQEEAKSQVQEMANSIIEDAKEMYLKIIEEANSEAKGIIDGANADAEGIRTSAKDEGFRQGYESGYSEGKDNAQSIIDEAVEIRNFLDARKEAMDREAEEEILGLVLDISKKIIGEEITQNQNAIITLIKQALLRCAFKNKLILKISPEDYEFVTENKNKICALVEGLTDIEIVSDPSLKKGGCVVETPSGEINASVNIQMKELERIFLYLLRNE